MLVVSTDIHLLLGGLWRVVRDVLGQPLGIIIRVIQHNCVQKSE